MKLEDFPTTEIDHCNWYHGTFEGSAKKIQDEGFKINYEAPAQYTAGVYFLDNPKHPRIRGYGNKMIKACVKGKFLDAYSEYVWYQFIDDYNKNYDLTRQKEKHDKILQDHPDLDGALIDIGNGNMLVVWKPEKINDIKIL